MKWGKKIIAATSLISLAVGTIHAINKLISYTATLNDFMSKTPGHYYEWRFGKIFYTKKGTGKPLLLIHDLNSFSSGYEWERVEEKLSKTNTVYTIDLLGCGRSDKPNLTYTNFLYVQLINDFIKHIIDEKTDIIATAESGSFVLFACNHDNSIIDKVMLVNPQNLTLLSKIPSKRSKALRLLISIPIIGTLIYNILSRRKKISDLFYDEYFSDLRPTDNHLVNLYYESAHKRNAKSKHLFASIKGYYTNANLIHCLKGINNSIFILTGTSDEKHLFAAKQYQEIAPSIEVVELPNAKLLPQLESPTSFVSQIHLLFETH